MTGYKPKQFRVLLAKGFFETGERVQEPFSVYFKHPNILLVFWNGYLQQYAIRHLKKEIFTKYIDAAINKFAKTINISNNKRMFGYSKEGIKKALENL